MQKSSKIPLMDLLVERRIERIDRLKASIMRNKTRSKAKRSKSRKVSKVKNKRK